jgi:biotin carboxyl carrier protein
MRYYVSIGDRKYEVDIAGDHDQVTVNGVEYVVELAEVNGTPVRRLFVNNAAHRIVAGKGEARGQWELHLDGYRVSAEVVDERTQAIRALTTKTAAIQGPRPIRAPMPGMITRVEVAPGDKVRAGQGIIIIEAMKMENELKTEAAGTVARVVVNAGTAVEKGAVLVEFAANE